MPAVPSSFALRDMPLLQGLSAERLETLARQCRWRSTEAQISLVANAAPDADLYLLVSGRVRVTTYSAGGRQVTFSDYDAGDYFGEVAAVDGRPRSADVLTLEPSVLAVLPRADFLALMRDEPLIGQRVMERLAGMVRRLSGRVVELSTLNVQQRLWAELLRLAQAGGAAVDGNQARLTPVPKHMDLASRISTNREQVARELSALSREGLVRKEGKTLLLADLATLRARLEAAREEA
ncbi:Crp/Fnr family transcriptional regulator [Roseateles sp. DAIF2]|nr:Crp/Fnr family transcriptional regulator [Roseateles sp. DAIF2]